MSQLVYTIVEAGKEGVTAKATMSASEALGVITLLNGAKFVVNPSGIRREDGYWDVTLEFFPVPTLLVVQDGDLFMELK